jgi:WD40 repeat protein
MQREDAKCILQVRHEEKPYARLAWCENGTIVGALGNALNFIDSSTGKVFDRVNQAHSKAITCLQCSSSEVKCASTAHHLVITGSKDNRVRVWAVPGVEDSI